MGVLGTKDAGANGSYKTEICSFNKCLLMSYFPCGLGTMDTHMPLTLGDTEVGGGDMHPNPTNQVGEYPALDRVIRTTPHPLVVVLQNVRGAFFKDHTFE